MLNAFSRQIKSNFNANIAFVFAKGSLIKMECSEVKEAWVKQIVLMIKSFFMTLVSVQFDLNDVY